MCIRKIGVKHTYQHVVTWLPCINKESDAYCALLKNPDKMKKLSDMIILPMTFRAVDHTS